MKPNLQLLRWSLLVRILSSACVALAALVFLLRSPRESPAALADVAVQASSSPGSMAQRRPAARPVEQPPALEEAAAPREEGAGWQEAFAAAAAISDPARRDEALVRLCYERAETNPRVALELALSHRLEEVPGGVIGNLAQQWATIDISAARAWVELQPPGEIREELVGRIGYLWSLSDPAAAAAFVTAETAPGEAQVEAALSVLHQWKDRDPAAARAWAECFPDGPERERALHEVADLPVPGD